MTKAFIKLVLIGMAILPALAGTGCESAGNEDSGEKPWNNPRYQDQKGHYHPEWVGKSDR